MIAPFLFVFADRISAASTRLAEKRGTSLGGIRIDKWDITQVAPVTLPPFADKLDYRVLPTHLLQVDFESALNNSATFVVQIAREADRWYVVAACPKPETKAAAEATRQARVKRAGRVRDFAAGIKPQQRETVLRLVREDRS